MHYLFGSRQTSPMPSLLTRMATAGSLLSAVLTLLSFYFILVSMGSGTPETLLVLTPLPLIPLMILLALAEDRSPVLGWFSAGVGLIGAAAILLAWGLGLLPMHLGVTSRIAGVLFLICFMGMGLWLMLLGIRWLFQSKRPQGLAVFGVVAGLSWVLVNLNGLFSFLLTQDQLLAFNLFWTIILLLWVASHLFWSLGAAWWLLGGERFSR